MDTFGGARPKKKSTKPKTETTGNSLENRVTTVTNVDLTNTESLSSSKTGPQDVRQTGSPGFKQTGIPDFKQTGIGSVTRSQSDYKMMSHELLVIIQTPMQPCDSGCRHCNIVDRNMTPSLHSNELYAIGEYRAKMAENESDKHSKKMSKKSSDDKINNVSTKEKWRQSGLALKNYVSAKLGFKGKKVKNGSLKSPVNESKTNGDCASTPNDAEYVPEKLSRSRSLLKYLSHKKDKVSKNFTSDKLIKSSSLELSSSDRPISSSDFSSATSDWSSENASTNQCSPCVNSLSNDISCTMCTCSAAKEPKDHNCCEFNPKKQNEPHLMCTKHKCRKQCKRNKMMKNNNHNCLKSTLDKNRGTVSHDTRNQGSHMATDSDSTDCTTDGQPGSSIGGSRTLKNPRHRKLRHSSNQTARDTDSTSDTKSYLSESTLNVLSGLQYAIPYLPERFRNHLSESELSRVTNRSSVASESGQLAQKTNSKQTGSSLGAASRNSSSHKATNNVTKNSDKDTNSRNKQEKQNFPKDSKTSQNLSTHCYEYTDTTRHDLIPSKPYSDTTSDCNNVLDNSASLLGLELSLEDPFHVREPVIDSSNDICSGLLDIVRTADFNDCSNASLNTSSSYGETDDIFSVTAEDRISSRPNALQLSSAESDSLNTNIYALSSSDENNVFNPALLLAGSSDLEHQSVTDNTCRLGHNFHDFDNQSSSIFDTCSNQSTLTDYYGNYNRSGLLDTCTTSEDQSTLNVSDSEFPGYKALNDSFDKMLQEDNSSTSDSPFREHLSRSRSNESGLRSRSSDENVEADDEFECDCQHCQFLLTHNNTSSAVAMATGNDDTMTTDSNEQDEEFNDFRIPFDLDLYADTNTDSELPYRSINSWDIGLPFQPNIPLLLSGSPLGELLEDVIEHMLAARPELFLDEPYPPARKDVIDSLPTITLTLTHLEQSPSCPICLCPSELEDLMTLLPCQHIFHPLCIQAWLNKSGTCPVCRRKIRST